MNLLFATFLFLVVAFDPVGKRIYTNNEACFFISYSAKGIREREYSPKLGMSYSFWMSVHPGGNRVLSYSGQGLHWLELPE